jgi:ATP/maltotriose-dependent transcriptional regulator MalT/DNA-binding SARP family transcriptional activator
LEGELTVAADSASRRGVSPGLIPRPRLDPLLDLIPLRRLGLVIGGAGYGKSTLVRDWAVGRRVAWVAMRDDPQSSRGLGGPLIDALGRAGVRIETQFESGAGAASETLAGIIAGAIEASGAGELILVIDDVQELAVDASPNGLLPAFIRQAPSSVHVVLISRSMPAFPIQRLRAHGETVDVRATDLAMDTDEVGRMVETVLGGEDEQLAAKLAGATSGWPALIRLVLESLRSVPTDARVAAVDRSMRSGEAIFPYLAEEVLAGEPPLVRELIRTVAPLDAFDGDLCRDLGIRDAARIVADLRSRGMFVMSAPDGHDRLSLHRLIRDYAKQRMPLEPRELRRIRSAAVRWLGRIGDAEGAIRSAIEAAEPDLTIELLRAYGTDLLRRGRVDVLVAAGASLPPEALDDRLALLIGDAATDRGLSSEATAYYTRTAGENRGLGAAVGWRLGRLHFERGEFGRAAELLAEAILEGASDVDRARLLAWRAMSAWHGDESDAYPLALEAIGAAVSSGDLGAISIAETAACYSLLKSDLRAARSHHAVALRAADEANDLVQRVRLRCAFEAGESSLSGQVDELTFILPAVEAAGNDRWLSRALHARALCLLDLGRYDEAESDLRRALEVSRRLGQNDFAPALFLADLHRIVGDLAEATEQYRGVLARAQEDRDLTSWAKCGLARILARADPAAAADLIEEALAEALPHHRRDVLIGAGFVAVALGRRDDAARFAEQALRLVESDETGDALAALAYAMEVVSLTIDDVAERRARLEEANGIWGRLGNDAEGAVTTLALAHLDTGPRARASQAAALRRVRAAGIRPSAADAASLLAAIPRERIPPIEIRTFGTFQVLRGGVPVPPGEWKSKKARDLLKILIARRTTVARDELIEALWPDEDPEATSNRLSVGLSLLRAVLDPSRSRPADTFVTTERGALRLVPGELVIDFEDFAVNAADGLALHRRGESGAAVERLLAAEALYGGELFEEDPYADWAVGPREETRGIYIQVARAIAEILANRGDVDDAIRYLMRIISRDPFDEAAHLGLVQALARGRHHGEARRAYQAYVSRMAELEIEAAAYPAS